MSLSRPEQFEKIQKQAYDIFVKKNADYGDAFAEFGVIGVFVRMEDKIKRLLSVNKNSISLVCDETVEDTLLDLHNYAAMALMLLNKEP